MTKEERIKEFKFFGEMKEIPNIQELTDWLDSNGFFDAPASTKYHGAYAGGLYDHSRAVYYALDAFTHDNDLTWSRKQSPFLIAFLHDLCKCDQYESAGTDANPTWQYKKDTLFTGHGDKSVMLLNFCPIRLTVEELVCVRYHMGAFTEKEQWNEYTNAIHTYPNVLWTHTADMYAAHVAMT